MVVIVKHGTQNVHEVWLKTNAAHRKRHKITPYVKFFAMIKVLIHVGLIK